MSRVRRVRDPLEDLGQRLGRHRGAVVEARMTARRRLHALGDPAVEVDQAGAEQAAIVDRVAHVLRTLGPAGGIGRHRRRVGRRPDADTMLGAGEVIDARERSRRDVATAVGVGVDERGVAAVVLGRGVGVKDLQPAPPCVEAPVERVGGAGHRIGRGHVGRREHVRHHLGSVLGVLAEALVELPAHAARHVGDDPVERLAPVLVDVQIPVDQRAQEAPRL